LFIIAYTKYISRPEHPFDIRPDLRKAAKTKAASVIRPHQLVRLQKTSNMAVIGSLTRPGLLTFVAMLISENLY
jgi:hypothetical protein